MDLLSLKRCLAGRVFRGTGDGTNGTGDGTNNGGDSNQGPTGGNYGGGSRGGGSYSGYTTGQASDPSSPAHDPGYGGGSTSNNEESSSNLVGKSPNEAQQTAMDVAMGFLSRDSMTGPESVRAANEATKEGTEATTSAKNFAKAVAEGEDTDRMEGVNPNNPTQSVSQMEASQNVSRAIGSAAPAIASALSPGFGLAMNAAKAFSTGDLDGFAGRMVGGFLGGRIGLPGFGGVGASIGESLATGKPLNAQNIATSYAKNLASNTVGSAVGGAVGKSVGGEFGSVAGTLAGSAAGRATRSGLNGIF